MQGYQTRMSREESNLAADSEPRGAAGMESSVWERLPSGMLLSLLWLVALLAALALLLGLTRGLR